MPDKIIFSILERGSKTALRNLNRFHEVLTNLRFEGNEGMEKNMAELLRLVAYFEKDVKAHMEEEEKFLFPFLRVHIPRLEPMISLLMAEHEDFKNSIDDLNLSISIFKRVSSDKVRVIHQLNEQGIYLIGLLRGHMMVEAKSLYRIADKELHPDEKKQLLRQIKKKLSRAAKR